MYLYVHVSCCYVVIDSKLFARVRFEARLFFLFLHYSLYDDVYVLFSSDLSFDARSKIRVQTMMMSHFNT